MIFKPMNLDELRQLLANQEDIITPAVKEHERFFRSLSCPRCGSSVAPYLDGSRIFRQNEILPNFLAKCTSCGCIFEPYTKIEISS